MMPIFDDGPDEPDAWVVVDQLGTMLSGPYGSREAAEQTCEARFSGWGFAVPIWND